MPKKEITKILQSQGFGSRKECTRIVRKIGVTIEGKEITDPKALFETEGLTFCIMDKEWLFREKVYILMNKPLNTECSRKPLVHPSVLGLLPAQLSERGIQPVGRLDVDTTGLLLITDDGQFNHKITSPKHVVEKVYRVTAKHAINDEFLKKLLDGVLLDDEEEIVKAQNIRAESALQFLMTLTEGKYHQVKRMVAAAGNRVEGLSRLSVGPFELGPLKEGEWRYLTEAEVADWI